MRHEDGTLYKPDLVIHKDGGSTVVCDVQVSWEGNVPMGTTYDNKRLVYDHPKFREAAKKRWPDKTLTFTPLIVGARGIWPRCNHPTVDALKLTDSVKSSCVHSALKWGSSIHRSFMKAIWKREKNKGGT